MTGVLPVLSHWTGLKAPPLASVPQRFHQMKVYAQKIKKDMFTSQFKGLVYDVS